MNMLFVRKYWTLLLVFMDIIGGDMVGCVAVGRYKLLYNGGLKINGAYTTYQTPSKASCAAICINKYGCWVFTWDSSKNDCQLLTVLTTAVQTISATSTIQTYYASNIDGKNIIKTTTTGSWLQGNNTCTSMGGRLFLPPDTTFSYILSHVYNAISFHVGMYRLISDTNVWYNMDGETSFPQPEWLPGEPNNANGAEIYGIIYNGLVADAHINFNSFALCEI
ncbi:hypothetical protein SK128_022693 [Halocaridina rubra]|uniref:Apple domain-containing protein n=1 Tax=Halocaridina rubra TaxID=373956 RepID=A0AAN8WFR2_HALRR